MGLLDDMRQQLLNPQPSNTTRRQAVYTPMQFPQGFGQQRAQAPQAPSHNQIMAGIPKQYKPDQKLPTTGGFAGGTSPQTIREAQKMTESQMGAKPNAGWITSESDVQKANQWNQQMQANAKYITDKKAKFQQDAARQVQTQLTIDALGETMTPSQKALYEAGFQQEVAEQLTKSPAATSAMENAQAIGFKPGSKEYVEFIRMQVTPKGTNVEVINAPENKGNIEWRKSQAKGLSEDIARHRERVTGNNETLDKLNRLGALNEQLQSGGYEGTGLDEIGNLARKYGVTMDLTGNDAPLAEAVALTNTMTLAEMSKQKGPQTKSDQDFIATTQASVDKPIETRRNIVSYQKSRIILDNMHMDALQDARTMETLDDSLEAFRTADKAYRTTPAGMTLSDGTTMTYSQFLTTLTAEEAEKPLESWIEMVKEEEEAIRGNK